MKSILNKCTLFASTVAISLLMAGCNSDFLDRPTLGSLDETTYLSTEDAGFKLLINCYQPILNQWDYQTMKFDLGDQLTDDCSKGGSDAGDRSVITEVTRGNPTATSSLLTQFWDHRYKQAISPCNVFLSLITPETQLIKTGGSLVSTEEKKRWIAEAYFMNYTGGSVCPQMNIGRAGAGGWGGECPTYDLVDEYEVGDPRLVHTVLSSGDIFVKSDGTEEVHDYSGYDNFSLQHSRKQYPDWSRRPIGDLLNTDWTFYHIRYADVLLMYAECLIETGDDKQKAVDLINQVRHRAFVTTSATDSYAKLRKFNLTDDKRVTEDIFNAKYKVKVSDDLQKALRHERRVELGCEGLRLYDLLRWGAFIPTMQAFGQTAEGKYSGAGTHVTDKTYPYPIPQNEIDYVGGSLTQNDNY